MNFFRRSLVSWKLWFAFYIGEVRDTILHVKIIIDVFFSRFQLSKKKKNIYYKKSFDRFKLVMWSKILQLSTNQYKDRGSILKEIEV